MKVVCPCGTDVEYDETLRGRPRKYCDELCRQKYSYKNWRREHNPYKKDLDRVYECPRCGMAFRQTPGRGTVKQFCGNCK